MKIAPPSADKLDLQQTLVELQTFIDQPTAVESPPCPGCKQHKIENCSSNCDDASEAISIEPERYPIEEHVLPVVFEMMASRLLQTCWSCEGHYDSEGKLWKLPQVCFYAATPIYPKLLTMHLYELSGQHKLSYEWQIVFVDLASTWGVTYSLQPSLLYVDKPDLELMQKDLLHIAQGMNLSLKQHAKQMMETISQQC